MTIVSCPRTSPMFIVQPVSTPRNWRRTWCEAGRIRRSIERTCSTRAVTEIGVAVAHSTKTGNYYGVQMFGRPKSLSFRFAIENKSEIPIEYNVGERLRAASALSPNSRRMPSG